MEFQIEALILLITKMTQKWHKNGIDVYMRLVKWQNSCQKMQKSDFKANLQCQKPSETF